MFGFGKVTCALCQKEVTRNGALRARDGQKFAVCRACYDRWSAAGRRCTACQTAVRGSQEVGVFLDHHALGHADCGGVLLTA